MDWTEVIVRYDCYVHSTLSIFLDSGFSISFTIHAVAFKYEEDIVTIIYMYYTILLAFRYNFINQYAVCTLSLFVYTVGLNTFMA